MNEDDGMAPGLSPEDQARVQKGLAEMLRRQRDNAYRPPPANPAKTKSMAPWMQTVQPPPDQDQESQQRGGEDS